MSSAFDRPIRVEIDPPIAPDQLLLGIEAWRDLGLLSDAQVKHLCRQHLTCAIPTPPLRPVLTQTPPSGDRDEQRPPRVPRSSTPRFTRLTQSFLEELSVRWLLFLGVFMTLVSSGLLAVSQWQRFPAAGQYGVLLAYTIVFWVASLWTQRQASLTLTAQTLRTVTLLLVPLNFWAMDRFELWSNPLGWGTLAIAATTLTGIVFQLTQTRGKPSAASKQGDGNFLRLSLLGLSYLHWGWRWDGWGVNFPIAAVYFGTIATASYCIWALRQNARQKARRNNNNAKPPDRATDSPLRNSIPLTLYALLILLGRALWFSSVPTAQMGLAWGICGWLFAHLAGTESIEGSDSGVDRRNAIHPFWNVTGFCLLVFGWIVCVFQLQYPLQAIAVSGLMVERLFDRLRRHWRRQDLTALYAIGWQMVFLIGVAIPDGFRDRAVTAGTQLVQAQQAPGSLLSLTWFPYLLFMLAVNTWIDRQQQPSLARFGDRLALGFGVFLAALGTFNPTLRSLNLVLSTATLAAVTHRRYPTSIFSIYLTHVTGLLTIASIVDWQFPSLPVRYWTAIGLAVMLAEWLVVCIWAYFPGTATSTNPSPRRETVGEGSTPSAPTPNSPSPQRRGFGEILWRSCWDLGLLLAGLTYFVMGSIPPWRGGLMWIVTPLMLTGMAGVLRDRGPFPHPRQVSAWLSLLGLLCAQMLTVNVPAVRLLSLVIATAAMGVNTRYLRHPIAAAVTVGFGLGAIGVAIGDRFSLSYPGWFVVGASVCLLLWLFAARFRHRTPSTLLRLYAQAAGGWANVLCVYNLGWLTWHSISVFDRLQSPSVAAVVAIGLTIVGLGMRRGGDPDNWTLYGLGWGLELLAIEGLYFFSADPIGLILVNLGLGLATQLLGDWWRRRTARPLPSGWHVIPLLYGGLATMLRLDVVAAWTGFITLGYAAIAIGIGRRYRAWKPLIYIGLVGVSVAAYEVLWYQIAGWDAGDRLVAIAALGTSILYLYRALAGPLVGYLRVSAAELQGFAHLHWGMSSIVLAWAALHPIKVDRGLGLATGVLLTRYAVMQGRQTDENESVSADREAWVYCGILEGVGVLIYIGHRLEIGEWVSPWLGAIAAIAAYFFSILPWSNWGWHPRPWRNSALVIPAVVAGVTSSVINAWSLLTIAMSYAFFARSHRQIRISYLSLVFVNWLLWQQCDRWHLTHPLWFAIPAFLSVVYITQVDPMLCQPAQRDARHVIQAIATAVFGFIALGTANWLVSGGIGLIILFSGIAFRIRAFLYVGTLVFLLDVVNQIIFLSWQHSFVKWAIGLTLGLMFIGIAANFETRREQIKRILRHWLVALEEWQ
jgi:hypothetical protein